MGKEPARIFQMFYKLNSGDELKFRITYSQVILIEISLGVR